jgi:hypothetical protein
MMHTSRLTCAVTVLTGAVLMPVAAFTQTLGGLLPAAERGRQQILVAQVDVTASRAERKRVLETADTDPLSLVRSGYYADANGSLRFQPLPSGNFSYGLAASSAVRRYEGDSKIAVLGHSAGGNIAWVTTTRTSLSGFGSFMYLPSYALDTIGIGGTGGFGYGGIGSLTSVSDSVGLLPSNTVDFPLSKRAAYGSNVGVNVSQRLTRRSSLLFSYGAARSDFEAADIPTLMSQRLSGRFSYSLTRDLSMQLGYGRRIVDYSRSTGVDRVALDEIDLGVNFRKSLSITESTTFAFSTGSTIEDDEGVRRARISGYASLNQELGRKGSLSVRYNRGGELRSGFGRPVFSDSLSVNGRWNLAPRLTASGATSGSLGRSGRRSASNNRVRSISGWARLGYAFSSRGQVYAQYLSYYQDIDPGVDFISSVQREQQNNTVRVGVSFALPLVTARTPRQRPTPERN